MSLNPWALSWAKEAAISFTKKAVWCMPSPLVWRNLVMGLSGAVGESNSILLSPFLKRETVASQQVVTSFFKIGESKIELLSPTAPESPIAKFLEKKGEGIHHLAFGVKDIVASLAKLKAQGFRLIDETPIQGADQKLIAFVHPKDTTGALIELCEPLQQGV